MEPAQVGSNTCPHLCTAAAAHAPAGVAQPAGRVVLDIDGTHDGRGSCHARYAALRHLQHVLGLACQAGSCTSATSCARHALPMPLMRPPPHLHPSAPGRAGPATGSSRAASAPPAAHRTQPRPAAPGRASAAGMGALREACLCAKMRGAVWAGMAAAATAAVHAQDTQAQSHLWLLREVWIPPCLHTGCCSRHLQAEWAGQHPSACAAYCSASRLAPGPAQLQLLSNHCGLARKQGHRSETCTGHACFYCWQQADAPAGRRATAAGCPPS